MNPNPYAGHATAESPNLLQALLGLEMQFMQQDTEQQQQQREFSGHTAFRAHESAHIEAYNADTIEESELFWVRQALPPDMQAELATCDQIVQQWDPTLPTPCRAVKVYLCRLLIESRETTSQISQDVGSSSESSTCEALSAREELGPGDDVFIWIKNDEQWQKLRPSISLPGAESANLYRNCLTGNGHGTSTPSSTALHRPMQLQGKVDRVKYRGSRVKDGCKVVLDSGAVLPPEQKVAKVRHRGRPGSFTTGKPVWRRLADYHVHVCPSDHVVRAYAMKETKDLGSMLPAFFSLPLSSSQFVMQQDWEGRFKMQHDKDLSALANLYSDINPSKMDTPVKRSVTDDNNSDINSSMMNTPAKRSVTDDNNNFLVGAGFKSRVGVEYLVNNHKQAIFHHSEKRSSSLGRHQMQVVLHCVVWFAR